MDNTIQIISLIISLLTFLGVGAYLAERLKHKAQRRNINEDEKEREKEEKRINEIRNVVKEEIAPLNEKVDRLVASSVLNDRCEMKVIYDRCKKQKFADQGDKVTMKELYDDYKANGGNHYKDFVDIWYNTVKDLPEQPKKKEILNEDK